MPVDIQIRTEGPLTKETVLTINQRRIQQPLKQQNIASLNQSKRDSRQCQMQRDPSGRQEQRSNAQTGGPRPAASHVPQGQPQIQTGPQIQQMRVPPLMNMVQKGQKVPLESAKKLTQVKACVGWNVQNPACEGDVSAFLLQGERVLGDDWFVFYGQELSPDGSVRFHAEAKPDREMISLDFGRLNPQVDKIVFILTINEALEKRLNFSMLKDTYIRLLDSASNQELVSFRIDEYYANVTSMMIGEIYRHNGAWKFNAVGNGVGKDLAGLCRMYGVQVE